MNTKAEHRSNRVEIPLEMDEHPVSHILSMFWDGGDPWGSAMAEGFALCDFLAGELAAPELIPAEMGYQMAWAGPERDDPIFDLLDECRDQVTPEAIGEYLVILHRFLDECRAAGLDY